MIRKMVLIFSFLITCSYAQNDIHKTFPAKSKLSLKVASGDCFIETTTGDEIRVDIEVRVEPVDSFEPDFTETGNTLKIRENWHGSSSGSVIWRLAVPNKTEIDFSSASGELSVSKIETQLEASTASGDILLESVKGEFECSTASGDVVIRSAEGKFDISTASGEVEVDNSSGDFEMSTASGEIKVDNVTGMFDLSCASGEIKGKKIILKDEASFSTASGDIEIKLAQTPGIDVSLSAASGDVTLDYAGNEIRGTFELTARKDRGKISAPFPFDKEEEVERHNYTYMIKSFSKDAAKPVIRLETASGRVELKK